MASDTLETWAAKIIAQKELEDELSVNTTSAAGGWKTLTDVVSMGLRSLQKAWDNTISDYQTKAKAVPFMEIEQYRTLALEFQYGDTLAFLGTKYGYVAVNAAKQVVDVCQVRFYGFTQGATDQAGLIIHPGKLDSNDDIQPLDTGEQIEFEAYMEDLKPCGRRIQYESGVAGNLILTIEVFYDPTKLNPDGSSFDDATIFPVIDAIKNYQDNYVNKTGKFSESELRRRIYAVDGISDIDYTHHRYDVAGGTTYINITDYEYEVVNKLVQYNKAGTPEVTYTEE